ncbi:MAG TPA: DUF6328 family protein [Acidimicrobiales bacterium]|nr:DUF6328 family protein [Acidimicrobiales bacterium]
MSDDRTERTAKGQDPTDPGRAETPEQRADHNLGDLLQELRVLALGVQVLFGFLLAIPFAKGFPRLDAPQRHLYVAGVALCCTAIALLIAPVAYHRAVFRTHQKAELVAVSNAMTLGGLAAVALAVSASVWLVVGEVCRGWPVPAISLAVLGLFVALWAVIPVTGRRRKVGRPAMSLPGSPR